MPQSSLSNPTPAPSSPLLRNLLLFGRLLRSMGVRVTSGQLIEVAQSLGHIDVRSKEDFRNTARCILVNRQEDLSVFDRAFEIFWRRWSDRTVDSPLRVVSEQLNGDEPMSTRTSQDENQNSGGSSTRPSRKERGLAEADGSDDPDAETSVIAIYSPGEVLRQKDFAQFSTDELADARRFLAGVRWDITMRRSRRSRPSPSGRRLDTRRSFRRSLRHGGELVDLAFRGPKMKRRPVVLLCDISGSMDRYTRLLLHFLHSMEHRLQRVEVFVFGTRLTRITPELRRRNPDAAIHAAAERVQDWSGGTRIGESIGTFNHRWARRVLGQGAIVLVISDGWDRGDPALLAAEMERLQRQSYRLLWLNPLLGSPEYQPLTQGMQAALPYVDDFLPVHNIASLERLAELLNRVQEGRPERRQIHHRTGGAA